MAAKSKAPRPFTLRIAAGCLGYAAPFMSTEVTRYYLNGVFVEPGKSGVIAVATDAHTLIALRDDLGYAARAAILVPGKGLAALCRKAPDAVLLARAPLAGKADIPVWLGAADALDDAAAAGEPHGTVAVIEGEYPAWRRVFPAALPAGARPAPGFQARYVERFRGPAEWALNGQKSAPIIIRQDAEGPAVVSPGGTHGKPWAGLIMPMRCDAPAALPEWLGQTGVKTVEAA